VRSRSAGPAEEGQAKKTTEASSFYDLSDKLGGQGQHRDKFQTCQPHDEDVGDLEKRGVGGGGDADREADVAGRGGRLERGLRERVPRAQARGGADGEGDEIERHDDERAVHHLLCEGQIADVMDACLDHAGLRQRVFADLRADGLEDDADAQALEAARRRAGTAAEEHRDRNGEKGHVAPLMVELTRVDGHEARRGVAGDHLVEALAEQRRQIRVDAVFHEPEGREQG